MAGAVVVTVNHLQRREAAARGATDEAGQNATRVAVAHSKLNQEHEKLKAELEETKEKADAAQ